MKKNLGKIFLLFIILWHVEISASTYEWSASANKTTAMRNEAIHLKYICEFSDKGELYVIDFSPALEDEKYSIKLLSQSESIRDGKRVSTYEYVAFVKVVGDISFDFDMLMKETTKESIKNTVLGRDNFKKEEFSLRAMRQKTLVVTILDTKTDLVGSFEIDLKKESPKLKAYEPYHMEVIINGVGNFDAIKPIELEMPGVKVFANSPLKSVELTKEGYRGTWSQKFAFVSETEFSIPQVKINYFNLQKQLVEELVSPSTKVEVTKGYTKEELLDNDDEVLLNYEYFYYVLTFLTGFLVAKIKRKKTKKQENKNDIFKEKINTIKSLDSLLLALVMEDSKKYTPLISEIETNKVTSLKEAKKRIENLPKD